MQKLRHKHTWLGRPSTLLLGFAVGLFSYGLTQPKHGFGRSDGNWQIDVGIVGVMAGLGLRRKENDAMEEVDERDLHCQDSISKSSEPENHRKD